MAKKRKIRIGRVLGWVFVGMLAVLGGSCFALQSEKVQTKITGRIIREIQGTTLKASVGSVHIIPFKTLVIKDLIVIDTEPYEEDPYNRGYNHTDTLVNAKDIRITFSLRGIRNKECFHLAKVKIKDIDYAIQIQEDTTRLSGQIGTLAKVFHKEETEGEMEELNAKFEIGKIQIDGLHFRMLSFDKPKIPYIGYGVNWGDLNITQGKIEAHNITCSDNKLTVYLDNCRGRESGGYQVRSDNGAKVTFSNTDLVIENFDYHDNYSDLNVEYFSMHFPTRASFCQYCDSVEMKATMAGSRLGTNTICTLISKPDSVKLVFDIYRASVYGPANRLSFTECRAKEEHGATIDATGTMFNLGKEGRQAFDLDINEISLQPEQLNWRFDTKGIAEGQKITLSGKLQGDLNEILTKLKIKLGDGKMDVDARLSHLSDTASPEIKASIQTDNLDAGVLTGEKILGPVSLNLDASAIIETKPGIIIDNLKVDKLTANGYPYSNIVGKGVFNGKRFDGKVICHDPNLDFLFQGIFDFSERTNNKVFKFFASIPYANLHNLNIDKDREVSTLQGCNINSNFRTINNGKAFIGEIGIDNLEFSDSKGRHDVGDIKISSHINTDITRISISSDFVNGGYVANKDFPGILEQIIARTTGRHIPSLHEGKEHKYTDGAFELDLKFSDSYNLASFLIPGLYIADGTTLTAKMDETGEIHLKAQSKRIAKSESFIKDFNLEADNKNDSITVKASGSELESNKFTLSGAEINANASKDTLKLCCAIAGGDPGTTNSRINLAGAFKRDNGNLEINVRPIEDSYITLNSDRWEFTPWNAKVSKDKLAVSNLTIHNKEQGINLSGKLGIAQTSRHDTLHLSISNLSYTTLEHLIKTDIGICGAINGGATICLPERTGDKAISLKLESRDTAGAKNMTLYGTYGIKESYLEAKAKFNAFEVGALKSLTRGMISQMSGKIFGDVSVKGPTYDLEIDSKEMRLADGYATVGPTGVSYSLDGTVSYGPDGLEINQFEIRDDQKGRAGICGNVQDISIEMKELKVLSKRDDGSQLSGNLALDGTINLRNEKDKPFLVNADISTTGGGRVNYNVATQAETSGNSILTFKDTNLSEKEKEDIAYKEKIAKAGTAIKSRTDFEIKGSVEVSPDIQLKIGLDSDGVNTITTQGEGLINIDMSSSDPEPNMTGTYAIDNGHYHLSLLGSLVNKDFTIQPGSTMKFGGNLLDTEFDIDAKYSLRASLGPLISDTTSVSAQRTVNCGLKITDKLSSPELAFSIDVPDLDPSTSAKVQSELNTEDKIQRQFMGLLVTGSFIPSDQGGIVNNTTSNMLYNNLSQIMTGQLNSILQKLEIPLDLGLNYKQNEAGNDIFDVAISTQMFNNRVMVNGSIGNRQYSTSSNEEMVGDVDVEIKLDRSGNTRLSLFSHSADAYSNFLDNTQRSGIGISYQKEFRRLKDLFIKKKNERD